MWITFDSGSDTLSVPVVTALAHFLSSGVQLPTAGYGLPHSLKPLRHQLIPKLGQESVALRVHLLH